MTNSTAAMGDMHKLSSIGGPEKGGSGGTGGGGGAGGKGGRGGGDGGWGGEGGRGGAGGLGGGRGTRRKLIAPLEASRPVLYAVGACSGSGGAASDWLARAPVGAPPLCRCCTPGRATRLTA